MKQHATSYHQQIVPVQTNNYINKDQITCLPSFPLNGLDNIIGNECLEIQEREHEIVQSKDVSLLELKD